MYRNNERIVMKYFYLFIGFILCMGPLKAVDLSSCHQNCFKNKLICNQQYGHTVNSCDKHLMACKGSCNSGKPQNAYYNPSLKVAFNPILEGKDVLKKVLGG